MPERDAGWVNAGRVGEETGRPRITVEVRAETAVNVDDVVRVRANPDRIQLFDAQPAPP
jgi:hypothetical protein